MDQQAKNYYSRERVAHVLTTARAGRHMGGRSFVLQNKGICMALRVSTMTTGFWEKNGGVQGSEKHASVRIAKSTEPSRADTSFKSCGSFREYTRFSWYLQARLKFT